MFHCNGWCFPWTVDHRRHPRLPARVARQADVRRDRRSQGDAPVRRADRHVDLLNAPDGEKRELDHPSSSSPPPRRRRKRARRHGRRRLQRHPPLRPDRDLWPGRRQRLERGLGRAGSAERAAKKARQGVTLHTARRPRRHGPGHDDAGAADGETIGEVMFRGNIVMKGYLKNEKATDEAFAGGWFHSGDLG
jgi:fatty-acyl-CoA synthase